MVPSALAFTVLAMVGLRIHVARQTRPGLGLPEERQLWIFRARASSMASPLRATPGDPPGDLAEALR
jgi:hypothetical protein